METIIKKALEGGWNEPKENCSYCETAGAVIFMDSLFWQAIGKACGWGTKTVQGTTSVGTKSFYEVQNYLQIALRFHEINLTEGWEFAVAYLQEVTK